MPLITDPLSVCFAATAAVLCVVHFHDRVAAAAAIVACGRKAVPDCSVCAGQGHS